MSTLDGTYLWYVDINTIPEQNSKQWKYLLSLLKIDEITKVLKYHYFDDQKRSLLSYMLQKDAIRNYSGINVDDQIHIMRSLENKPYACVEGKSLGAWNYNVSHHGDFVCLVSHSQLLVKGKIIL